MLIAALLIATLLIATLLIATLLVAALLIVTLLVATLLVTTLLIAALLVATLLITALLVTTLLVITLLVATLLVATLLIATLLIGALLIATLLIAALLVAALLIASLLIAVSLGRRLVLQQFVQLFKFFAVVNILRQSLAPTVFQRTITGTFFARSGIPRIAVSASVCVGAFCSTLVGLIGGLRVRIVLVGSRRALCFRSVGSSAAAGFRRIVAAAPLRTFGSPFVATAFGRSI